MTKVNRAKIAARRTRCPQAESSASQADDKMPNYKDDILDQLLYSDGCPAMICLLEDIASGLEQHLSRAADEIIRLRNENRSLKSSSQRDPEIDDLRARVLRLMKAVEWALGEGDSDFGDRKPDDAAPFWWRKELRKRAGMNAAKKDDA